MRKFFEVGTMEWRFTGGEPTTQPDLFDQIATAKKLGMNVGLYTNGWWSKTIAQKVLDAGLNEIVISVEGRPEINDKRRKSGSFAKAIESLERIREFNRGKSEGRIKGIVATAIGRDNVSEIEFLMRLAAQYGVDINFMPLKPSGRARSTLTGTYLAPPRVHAICSTGSANAWSTRS
jgi:MoaA/NifB/PqqE/SkfB family radical SAM enzyme